MTGTGAYRSGKPADRLTRIADAMADVLATHPEGGGDMRAVIMLHDENRGGIAVAGYGGDDGAAAIADILVHLKAMFEANGKTFMIMTDTMDTGPN